MSDHLTQAHERQLEAANERIGTLEAALREVDGAIARLLTDTAHISDEHLAARHEREPSVGYDDVLVGRTARAKIKGVLNG